MIEIISIIIFFFKLKEMLNKKGRGMGLAFLGPVFWIVGELLGLFIAAIVLAVMGVDEILIIYGGGIAGGFIGGFSAYFIVRAVSPIPMYCPSCKSALPSDTSRERAEITCKNCETELLVCLDEISIVKAQ